MYVERIAVSSEKGHLRHSLGGDGGSDPVGGAHHPGGPLGLGEGGRGKHNRDLEGTYGLCFAEVVHSTHGPFEGLVQGYAVGLLPLVRVRH